MEDLTAFNVREVNRAAAEERERYEYSSAEENSESRSKKQSRPNELSENCRKSVVWSGGRAEKKKTFDRIGW